MPEKTKKTEPAKYGASVRIPPRAYAIAQRLAKRDRRTLSATIELALVAYNERKP